MGQSFPKTLIVDIGKSWTKSNLVSVNENKLKLEKSLSLPTSIGDISFAYNQIISKFKVDKEAKIVLTGSIPEAETFAKNLDVSYISEEDAKGSFVSYLEKKGFKNAIVLDAGDYKFSNNTKVSQLGAFLTNAASEIDIENYFGNKALNPRFIPLTQLHLELEEAFLRLAFASNKTFLLGKNMVNAVITGSFISLGPHRSRIGLIIADILSAGRSAQVKLDTKLFSHSFGALIKADAAFAELETDFLTDLGGFVSFGGKGKVQLDYGYTENQEIEINEDEIALVPTSTEQEVKVSFLNTKPIQKITLHGGLFGILLDGRLKPLHLSFGNPKSREAVKRWSNAISKMEVIE